jgi:hypothetical protein
VRTNKRTVQGLAAVLVGGGVLLGASPAAMAAPRSPLTSPNNLHAVSITDQDIALAWDASTARSGGVTYDLFFDNNATPFLVTDNQFDVTLNQAIGMVPGSTHTFRVQAEDTSGHTASSNTLTVSFAPGDNTPPTTPTNLHAVSMTADGIELAWDPSTDGSAFTYNIVSLVGCPTFVVPAATTQVLVPSIDRDPVCGILPGLTVSFEIFARDALGNTSGSSTLTVTYAPQG